MNLGVIVVVGVTTDLVPQCGKLAQDRGHGRVFEHHRRDEEGRGDALLGEPGRRRTDVPRIVVPVQVDRDRAPDRAVVRPTRGSGRAEAGTTAGRRVTTSDRPADPPSDGRATPKVGCRRPRLPPALMLPPDSHSSWHKTSRNVVSGGRVAAHPSALRCTMTKVTQRVRLLALGGVVGPVVFVVSWAVAGATTSGYSAVDGAISDLAATGASTQVAMTVSFVVFGIGVIAFGFALREVLAGPAWIAAVVTGACTIGVAATPLHGWSGDEVHGTFAVIGYTAIVALPLLAAAPLAAAAGGAGRACQWWWRRPRPRAWSRPRSEPRTACGNASGSRWPTPGSSPPRRTSSPVRRLPGATESSRCVRIGSNVVIRDPYNRRGGPTTNSITRGQSMKRLTSLARGLVRHLPARPYPSDHPWRHRHDPARPRG